MREYWIPACLPEELEPDATPMRLKLLGEKLIAFRDSEGRIGILDHRCPHRCASMFFGRNEEGGLRCAYHGWKFDVEGNCLDHAQPPGGPALHRQVKAKAYKVAEQGGLIWVYMGKRRGAAAAAGARGLQPARRRAHRHVPQRDCNWLQSLEGDIDTSHFGFLHVGAVKPTTSIPTPMHRYGLLDRAPRYHVKETDWGTMYTAYRPAKPGNHFHRFAHFMFPCFALVPDGTFGNMIQATLSVPLDDSHTMTYVLAWTKRDMRCARLKDGSPIPGAGSPRLPADHHRLARPLAPQGQPRQRLPDRSRGAGERQVVLRHPGHRPAGPGDGRKHGGREGIVDRGFENLAPATA